MKLEQDIDTFFNSASPAKIEELLKESNFDFYNELGLQLGPDLGSTLLGYAKAEPTVQPTRDAGDSWQPPAGAQKQFSAAGNNEEMLLAA